MFFLHLEAILNVGFFMNPFQVSDLAFVNMATTIVSRVSDRLTVPKFFSPFRIRGIVLPLFPLRILFYLFTAITNELSLRFEGESNWPSSHHKCKHFNLSVQVCLHLIRLEVSSYSYEALHLPVTIIPQFWRLIFLVRLFSTLDILCASVSNG